ncbi:hypothetical protein ACFQZ1_15805 [Bacillus sp. CGMCC 1.60114]|uniref:hypothetical protein n=1 Tax=unclassified Bacillus (in: firmicutes) TaxID=185979 RepID=UPI00362EEDBD
MSVTDIPVTLKRIKKLIQVAGVLPLVNFQVQTLQNVLSKTNEEYTITDIKKISDRIEYWIKNWYPQKMIGVNDKKDIEYYETLNERQKKWLRS